MFHSLAVRRPTRSALPEVGDHVPGARHRVPGLLGRPGGAGLRAVERRVTESADWPDSYYSKVVHVGTAAFCLRFVTGLVVPFLAVAIRLYR